MERIISLSIFMLSFIIVSIAQNQNDFMVTVKVGEEDLKNKSILELICGQYMMEKLKPMIKQDYQGKAGNIMVIGTEEGCVIKFTVYTDKMYNVQKLCERVKEEILTYLKDNRVDVLSSDCIKLKN